MPLGPGTISVKDETLLQKEPATLLEKPLAPLFGSTLGCMVLMVFDHRPKCNPCLGYYMVYNFILSVGKWDFPKLLATFDPKVPPSSQQLLSHPFVVRTFGFGLVLQMANSRQNQPT
ncbi:hypothetical protein TorRG33x02_004150 [Trema orientale]|uniref:Uncharacterized protein n=1 Tax=Trema orientale TaxID=63057 RepID=A0A2P5G270_TREOI|nr:hypothetical protein TorRG33x02_004150 [Trema orientale]